MDDEDIKFRKDRRKERYDHDERNESVQEMFPDDIPEISFTEIEFDIEKDIKRLQSKLRALMYFLNEEKSKSKRGKEDTAKIAELQNIIDSTNKKITELEGELFFFERRVELKLPEPEYDETGNLIVPPPPPKPKIDGKKKRKSKKKKSKKRKSKKSNKKSKKRKYA